MISVRGDATFYGIFPSVAIEGIEEPKGHAVSRDKRSKGHAVSRDDVDQWDNGAEIDGDCHVTVGTGEERERERERDRERERERDSIELSLMGPSWHNSLSGTICGHSFSLDLGSRCPTRVSWCQSVPNYRCCCCRRCRRYYCGLLVDISIQ